MIKEESQSNQKSESGFFGIVSSYFAPETAASKGPSPEEEEAIKHATKCVRDCQLEQLIVDSKFLREESLHELIKVIIRKSKLVLTNDIVGY